MSAAQVGALPHSVLVLGASSGIGAALVRRLDGRVERIVGASRSGTLPAGVGPGAVALRCDVRVYEDVDRTLTRAAAPGGLGAIVNCAGVGYYAPLDGDHSAQWRAIVETTVLGTLHVLSVVQRRLPELGTLVHVSSLAAHRGSRTPGNLSYTVSKRAAHAAVETFRQTLREGGRRTRVGIVTPGYVSGTNFEQDFFTHAPEHRQVLIPPGCGLDPDDVAEAVEFLLTRPPRVELGDIVLRPLAQPD